MSLPVNASAKVLSAGYVHPQRPRRGRSCACAEGDTGKPLISERVGEHVSQGRVCIATSLYDCMDDGGNGNKLQEAINPLAKDPGSRVRTVIAHSVGQRGIPRCSLGPGTSKVSLLD